MTFTKIEENIVKINLHRSAKLIQKMIGVKHSIKSINDKKYRLKKIKSRKVVI